jgi:hypothetical protein
MYQCMGVVKTVERLNCIIDAYCEASPYQP